jgi:polyhydroxyalkanoate synthesis regulator phasin
MAIKFPSFKIISTSNVKSRVFLLLIAVVVIIGGLFFLARYLSGDKSTVGSSRVASAPAGLQSVPGGQLSPEYYRALMQANAQSAQQAQITGTSALPTIVNVAQPAAQPQQNCTVLCPSDDNVNVADEINNLVKGGKLPQKDADMLLAMAKNNVPVDEYAAALDRLVKEGKLTPEQARKLLEQYKKQHQNALLNETAKAMDGMIKSGQLPLDVANQLLALQKSNISPADYAEQLNRLVKEGKISPKTAADLLGQYTQQQAREAAKQGVFELQQLAKAGAITQDVATALAKMQEKNVPVDQYAAALQQLVSQGKITPAEAAKLLDAYKARRLALGGTSGTLEALIQQQEIACQQDLEAQKKTVKQNSQTQPPLPVSCQKLNDLKAQAQRLMALQANNGSAAAYAEELKRAVQAGLLSPEDAAQLLQYYEASVVPVDGSIPTTSTNLPTTEDFAKLQQAIKANNVAPVTPAQTAPAAQFDAAAAQANQQALIDRAQRIQQLQAAMSNQAQSLLTAWQPPKMVHAGGSEPATLKPENGAAGGAAGATTTTTTTTGGSGVTERPLIKSGTIMFGVLDTAVDSDYPDTPVMVTLVQGPFKGAKLLGKLSLAQGKDRVSLVFEAMDRDDWPKTKKISAFAIDPDTARTVMASDVDHHYMMRYGSLFASSFMSGYATGITNAGTATTGIFGTSTTHPDLSFGKNVAVGLGQVGTTFTNVVQGYVNTPATVKVNSGVGLGILFMSDVT